MEEALAFFDHLNLSLLFLWPIIFLAHIYVLSIYGLLLVAVQMLRRRSSKYIMVS